MAHCTNSTACAVYSFIYEVMRISNCFLCHCTGSRQFEDRWVVDEFLALVCCFLLRQGKLLAGECGQGEKEVLVAEPQIEQQMTMLIDHLTEGGRDLSPSEFMNSLDCIRHDSKFYSQQLRRMSPWLYFSIDIKEKICCLPAKLFRPCTRGLEVM
jgi:hypothetical protein